MSSEVARNELDSALYVIGRGLVAPAGVDAEQAAQVNNAFGTVTSLVEGGNLDVVSQLRARTVEAHAGVVNRLLAGESRSEEDVFDLFGRLGAVATWASEIPQEQLAQDGMRAALDVLLLSLGLAANREPGMHSLPGVAVPEEVVTQRYVQANRYGAVSDMSVVRRSDEEQDVVLPLLPRNTRKTKDTTPSHGVVEGGSFRMLRLNVNLLLKNREMRRHNVIQTGLDLKPAELRMLLLREGAAESVQGSHGESPLLFSAFSRKLSRIVAGLGFGVESGDPQATLSDEE